MPGKNSRKKGSGRNTSRTPDGGSRKQAASSESDSRTKKGSGKDKENMSQAPPVAVVHEQVETVQDSGMARMEGRVAGNDRPEKSTILPKKRRSVSAKSCPTNEEENAMVVSKIHIKMAVLACIWPEDKFFPQNQDHQFDICQRVFRWLQAENYVAEDKSDYEIHTWITLNSALIAKELNNHRNYVISGIKKQVIKYWKMHGEDKLPKPADIRKCVLRDPDLTDLENAANFDLFEWYWTALLEKAPGNAHDWSEEIYQFNCIFNGRNEQEGGRLYITPSHEAFVAVAYENYWQKWIKMQELKELHPEVTVRNRKPKAGDKSAYVLETDKKGTSHIYIQSDEYRGKWTRNDGGSKQSAGWAREAMETYARTLNKNRKARKTKEGRGLEQKFLAKLKQKRGIVADDYATHQAMNKQNADGTGLNAADDWDFRDLIDDESDESYVSDVEDSGEATTEAVSNEAE